MTIKFDEIEIIEWYDGVVRGIAKSGAKYYLIVMLSWKNNLRERQFGFVELKTKDVLQFKGCFEESDDLEKNWKCFETYYESFVKTYKGKLYLSNQYPEIKEEYRFELADYSKHKKLFQNYDLVKI